MSGFFPYIVSSPSSPNMPSITALLPWLRMHVFIFVYQHEENLTFSHSFTPWLYVRAHVWLTCIHIYSWDSHDISTYIIYTCTHTHSLCSITHVCKEYMRPYVHAHMFHKYLRHVACTHGLVPQHHANMHACIHGSLVSIIRR